MGTPTDFQKTMGLTVGNIEIGGVTKQDQEKIQASFSNSPAVQALMNQMMQGDLQAFSDKEPEFQFGWSGFKYSIVGGSMGLPSVSPAKIEPKGVEMTEPGRRKITLEE